MQDKLNQSSRLIGQGGQMEADLSLNYYASLQRNN